ncbi:ABC transporter permease subunit [Klugiella xanthotipulae]|uniref:ABC-type transport system involved in multi-copper enzyme maturation permease subunit n=1 Tax=Klugiella xanthotipulae TaxID=244735 RepID=A0A543HXE3_9MICO|nr:ABC transporter permease [Klugiella xanthotipulae]TQM63028.1 hypothetical protein FB466_1277 [Klugiella xanthotipulae]
MKTIIEIELRQRIRGIGWWVMLGIWTLGIALITLFTLIILGTTDSGDSSAWLYSTIVLFSLLMATLVIPALSGGSINGDRQEGTLATTQVTLVSTGQIVLGKFLAAWLCSLAFVATATPFLVIAALREGINPVVVIVSLAVLIAEMGIISGIGVGMSGLMPRQLFSVVSTYLMVALLTIGTPIIFALLVGTTVTHKETTVRSYSLDDYGSSCDEVTIEDRSYARSDRYWWILAANPFVVLADATPATFNDGYVEGLLGGLKLAVRQAQIPPEMPDTINYCEENDYSDGGDDENTVNTTVPSWFVGLGLHVLIAGAFLAGAVRKTRTPARTLPRGQRIA